MSRNKPYQNRLEELFSSTEPVPPEPVKTIPPAEADRADADPGSASLTDRADRGDADNESAYRGEVASQGGDQELQVSYCDTPTAIDSELSRVMEIGRALAQAQELAPLLEAAANLTCERFSLSSVQIYLYEPAKDRLVLRGASGAEGEALCRQGYSLAIDAHSSAGIAFATEQPEQVPHTTLTPSTAQVLSGTHPYTVSSPTASVRPVSSPTASVRPELALPLLSGLSSPTASVRREQAFGVLVLQSARPGSFSANRPLIYELLASRLAASIDHLRLYAQAAPHQAETQVRIGWDEFLDAINRKENIGYTYAPSPAEADKDHPAVAETMVETIVETQDIASLPAPLKSPAASVGAPAASVRTNLQVGSETIGTLLLERDGDGSHPVWENGEVELVKSIADRIAQHLENLRLLAQAERYREEAEEAARRLTREGWESYLETPHAPLSGYVYELDQVKPIEEDTVGTDHRRAVEPVPGAADADLGSAYRQMHTLTGAIKVRDELIGEVEAVSVPSGEAGGQQNDELAAGILAAVTDRLGTHIENLRLLEETERSRQQLDRRAAELETVARVSTAAATILSPQELLQSVVDLTKYSFNLYHAHVYLLDESKSSLVLKAGAGKIGYRMVSEGETIPLDESKSVVARAAQTRSVVMVNDVRQDQGFLYHPQLPGALSEMAVPMVVGALLVGVFDVLASVTDRFTDEDMRTYNTLASQVAVALRNAELYAEQMATVVRLRELDHLKSSFLANMSHELRTPLNSILGFAQVILEGLDGPLTADMSNDLGLIDKNGKHLLYLINEILDMAKIEAGRLSLSPEPVNLRSLIEDVLESSASLVRERSLYLRIESEEQADVTLMLDYTRMRQVFLNLVGNASKFTETGGITVDFEKQATKVVIHFRDTGIGIPPNKLDMIFEQFSQVDTSTTRKAGGTGLGLPISRRLVELHGGRLWANSTGVAGEGSVFTVELPLIQVSAGVAKV